MPYRTKIEFTPQEASSSPEKNLQGSTSPTKTLAILCTMCKKPYGEEVVPLTPNDIARSKYPQYFYSAADERAFKSGFCSIKCDKEWTDEDRRKKHFLRDIESFEEALKLGLVNPSCLVTRTTAHADEVTFYGHDVGRLIRKHPINLTPFILSLTLHRVNSDLYDQDFRSYFEANYPTSLDYATFSANFSMLSTRNIISFLK